MHPILKLFHSHRFLERRRVEMDREPGWSKVDKITGKEIPGSRFAKVTYIVTEECTHPDCSAQLAFKEVVIDGGPEDGDVESRIEIHPDLAKEKVFISKL